MIRNVITLLLHDLAVAIKNKTIYLIGCIPIFVYATLTLVDTAGGSDAGVKLVLVGTEAYPTVVLESLMRESNHVAVTWASHEEEATRRLKQRSVDGILMTDAGDRSRLQLIVIQQASVQTLSIMQRLTALQAGAEGRGPDWIADVRALQTSAIKQQTLPTWILTMVLLVGFIVLPAQIAEEKEKQWLLGLLQTPMREGEWLVAKLAYGMILMFVAVLAVQLLSQAPCASWPYLAMLAAGSFCFCAAGTTLGLLCRSQASARALGVLCYLPLLMPAVLSDTSRQLRSFAQFLPSYVFYVPIQTLLLDKSSTATFSVEWLVLFGLGVASCLLSYKLIKARWLM